MNSYSTASFTEKMSEGDVIDRTEKPVTIERMITDLGDLGISAGDVLLVHSSMSSIGWTPGGPPAVVDALMETLTADGTLVMPTHSAGYSEPSDWENPPVPDSWYETIRESMPPFRPEVTPCSWMGSIPECFRSYPHVRRSRHPEVSFAAWGRHRDEIIDGHTYDFALGEGSPLARIYDLDGDVLLLGVDHDSNTSLHLAEYRAEWNVKVTDHGGPVLVDGERRWITYEDLPFDSDDFDRLGSDFEEEHEIARGTVGQAQSMLVSQRELVDFGEKWIEQYR